jgi:hypothetical protein
VGRPPEGRGLDSAADALVETRSTLARRQHEHRSRTADRLQAVVDTNLLPEPLAEMAVYYPPLSVAAARPFSE